MVKSQSVSQQESLLLVIDIQSRLAPAIDRARDIVHAADRLLNVASELHVPCVFTEQYPQGLGTTVEQLATHVENATLFEKIHFSAYREADFVRFLEQQKRSQVVILGTEAHVCVLQTALDLLAAGFQVFVVEDAVGSRRGQDKSIALSRLTKAGAVIVSSEMVIFEWLERAGTDVFKHISKTYIR
ncbi:hydrolase [Aliidiomarina shirensis]|uniref:Hydrolase n=1 Tax=Aliidiomarina shirensis TaxID=1048642 RepID=A0A432WP47_9GAMM|nr:hydrolase [Aliidiomarina shirensis]RUO35572.1 hydrolase [Aliidiomarina shirensis]